MAQLMYAISDITSEGTGSYVDIADTDTRPTPDHSDYWYSTNNSNQVHEVLMTDLSSSTPGAGTCTVTIYHAQADSDAGTVAPSSGGNNTTWTLEVYEGATQIATSGSQNSSEGSFASYSSLTFAVSSITDWSDVRLRFSASGSGGPSANRRAAAWSYAQISTPDSAGATIDESITYSVNQGLDSSTALDVLFSYNLEVDKLLSQYKNANTNISFFSELDYNQSITFQEAMTIALQLTQLESSNKSTSVSINLQNLLDYIFSNLLTGAKSITIGALLDKLLTPTKITSVSQSIDAELDATYSGIVAIVGSVAFGLTANYLTTNYKVAAAQISIDAVLDKADQVQAILNDTVAFNYTLNFLRSTSPIGVLDDPIFTGDNYIFVDLTNIILNLGTLSASITFTTELGVTRSVGLIGEAAATFLAYLTQQQNIIAQESQTFAVQLDDSYNVAQLLSFTASLDLGALPTSQLTILRNIIYDIANNIEYSTVKDSNNILTFTTQLDLQLLNQLIANINIDFTTNLDQTLAILADLNTAISFLSDLNFQFVSGTFESLSFDLNLIQTEAVQQILNPTITLLTNLSQVAQKQKITNETLTFLTQLQQQQNAYVAILASINFAAELNQVEVNNLTVDKAYTLIMNLAESSDIQLDKLETVLLLTQLGSAYSNAKVVSSSMLFNAEFTQAQTNLLTKLLSMVFVNSLNYINTVQIDFNTLVQFGAILSDFYVGDGQGVISGLITFALNLGSQNVGISNLFENISFDSIADLVALGGRSFLDSISISVQLDQLPTVNLTQSGQVTFVTNLSKILGSTRDLRPSINFDLQALEGSTASKNTLASILLGMESSLAQSSTRSVPALISYGLTNDLETTLQMTLEGTVTLSTELAQSPALQMLGQIGITFGHLIGLSALSSADFAESIAFGTVTDFMADGFVVVFTVTTPDGRKLKVYFEDRITIIDEENRILKVFKDPSTTIK